MRAPVVVLEPGKHPYVSSIAVNARPGVVPSCSRFTKWYSKLFARISPLAAPGLLHGNWKAVLTSRQPVSTTFAVPVVVVVVKLVFPLASLQRNFSPLLHSISTGVPVISPTHSAAPSQCASYSPAEASAGRAARARAVSAPAASSVNLFMICLSLVYQRLTARRGAGSFRHIRSPSHQSTCFDGTGRSEMRGPQGAALWLLPFSTQGRLSVLDKDDALDAYNACLNGIEPVPHPLRECGGRSLPAVLPPANDPTLASESSSHSGQTPAPGPAW